MRAQQFIHFLRTLGLYSEATARSRPLSLCCVASWIEPVSLAKAHAGTMIVDAVVLARCWLGEQVHVVQVFHPFAPCADRAAAQASAGQALEPVIAATCSWNAVCLMVGVLAYDSAVLLATYLKRTFEALLAKESLANLLLDSRLLQSIFALGC